MAVHEDRIIMTVEDSPEDYEALIRAFSKAGISNPLIHCEDGDEALDYLFRRGRFQDPARSPRPALLLLDLNLPGMDGREVLRTVKADEVLCTIPVVVLTTSDAEDDIAKCYADGANSYIQKPIDLKGLVLALKRLSDFWFDTALLPDDII